MNHLKRDGTLCPAFIKAHYIMVDGDLVHRLGRYKGRVAGCKKNGQRWIGIKGKEYKYTLIQRILHIYNASLSSRKANELRLNKDIE